MLPLRERLGPGARRRRSGKRERRLEAGHVPSKVTVHAPRTRAGKHEEQVGLLARIRERVGKMLGPDATAQQKKVASAELARYLGLASGAAAEKKRRRKIRQASQRRNR